MGIVVGNQLSGKCKRKSQIAKIKFATASNLQKPCKPALFAGKLTLRQFGLGIPDFLTALRVPNNIWTKNTLVRGARFGGPWQ